MNIILKRLGLDEKETATFLKLLELGPQPVSVIAKHMGTPRSSMYVILERLESLQLIEEFNRSEIKYVKCISPQNLVDVLKTKEKEIQHTMTLLEEKLPELNAIENKLAVTPSVKFYEGKKAVMLMYENVLKEDWFYAFLNPKSVKEMMPEYHYKIPETLKARNGKAKELLIDCEDAMEYKEKYSSKSHQIKILPKNVDFSSDTLICKNKIYMVSYGEKQVSAIEISNESLAYTQKIIFEQLWSSIA